MAAVLVTGEAMWQCADLAQSIAERLADIAAVGLGDYDDLEKAVLLLEQVLDDVRELEERVEGLIQVAARELRGQEGWT
jgi:hypothetical protein